MFLHSNSRVGNGAAGKKLPNVQKSTKVPFVNDNCDISIFRPDLTHITTNKIDKTVDDIFGGRKSSYVTCVQSEAERFPLFYSTPECGYFCPALYCKNCFFLVFSLLFFFLLAFEIFQDVKGTKYTVTLMLLAEYCWSITSNSWKLQVILFDCLLALITTKDHGLVTIGHIL